jgi:NadR type nicotinamide-nucleotide adenylyltransferase
MLKIVLTGPESTGKSTLANQLANHFEASIAPEFARYFINNLDRDYVEADLFEIAKGQLDNEQHQSLLTNEILICDTDLLTIKIWSEFKFGKCDPQILEWIEERKYDHYLLCGTDVEWQFDPQRENPKERVELYEIYKKELTFYNKPFTEIAGNENQRFQKASHLIEQLLII